MLEHEMPTGGRHRQLSCAGVLVAMMLALSDQRPAQLAAGHRGLSSIPLRDRLRLGLSWRDEDNVVHDVSYREFADTFKVMTRSIDPSPVPSFKGVAVSGRAAHLEAVRQGIDRDHRQRRLEAFSDALLEQSIESRYKNASSSVAVDWTDYETWSRPRPKDDPVPANDPDASWGHAKRNAPGAKDCLFFGFYAQVVTMVGDVGGDKVPELVRRIAFAAPRFDPPPLIARTLVRMREVARPGDVICDCGYSNRAPESFAIPLRQIGAQLVMDLHPGDRGAKGSFEGAILSGGQLYCPATPRALLELGSLPRGATPDQTEAHDSRTAELARYKLAQISGPDADGYVRVRCPASAGKLRCPRKPASLQLSGDRPTVTAAPEEFLPRCCSQATLTVPPQVNAKTRQRHDYPSKEHRISYARRTAAERTYASLADPSVGGLRRGWCRLFGVTGNTVMYVLANVVRNIRIAEHYKHKVAEDARRNAKTPPRRRRRRYATAPSGEEQGHPVEPATHPD
jgi:hypothetical protein